MTILLFQHVRKCATSFIVSGEKSAVICDVFSQRSLFKILFFILRFKKFDLIYLGVDILGFTQFIVCSIISICRFMFFCKICRGGEWWGGAIISLSAFLFLLLIPSPHGTLITQMLDFFHYSLTGVWTSVNYSRLLSFCSVWEISTVLYSALLIFFPSILLLSHSLSFHCLIILYISVLKLPLGLLRLSIYFLRDFCLFVSSICKCCWNILSWPLYTLCQIILISLSSQW